MRFGRCNASLDAILHMGRLLTYAYNLSPVALAIEGGVATAGSRHAMCFRDCKVFHMDRRRWREHVGQ